jgi:hypothetical protein
MATLYFNGAVDNDWATLGNWWTDAACTSAAAGLPTSSDSVVATANINGISMATPTVVNFTTSAYLQAPVTVTGVATFSGSSARLTSGSGVIAGNAVFQNGAQLWEYGYVTGNATFHDTAYTHTQVSIDGNVTVTASTFSDYPLNLSINSIGGTITFSSPTPVVFNLSYFFIGSGNNYTPAIPAVSAFTAGTPTWNVSNSNIQQSLPGNVNASSATVIWANIGGNLTLDSGYMQMGTVGGNASFVNGAAFTNGTISGNATFASNGYASGSPPWQYWNSYFPYVAGSATFTGAGSYAAWLWVAGEFRPDVASAQRMLSEDYVGNATDGTVTITYGKGVNGSSILGVV